MGGLRQRYAVVTDQSWELARAAYVGGLSARVVCERFGMGEDNLRKRAREQGWTKRAWAAARATNSGATADGPAPKAPPEPAADADVLDAVLARARAALTGGRGGEASALLKATREYVLVRQDIEDARALHRSQRARWDRIAPDRAGPLDEQATVQTLHARWSRLSDLELARRADPTDQTGVVDWVRTMAEESESGDTHPRP